MKRIKIGHIGLGRLGRQHAYNLKFRISSAELKALCDIDEKALEDLASAWGVEKRYRDFEEMVKDAELEAVSISSPSGLHCAQIELALQNGKHVFCEKPLGVTLEECSYLLELEKKYPDLIIMPGFMRRFDPSYKEAKDRIERGEIGKPFMIRSYSQDPIKNIAGAIAYAPHSGGEFLDMCVHDIDLCRWYLGAEPAEVYAIGGCYAFEEFAQYNDGDNVSCLMKFENDAMAFLFAGRTAPHGYNVETEIIGTEGILRIANVPQKNLLEILDKNGVRKECSQNFLERFETAYLKEMEEFLSCVAEGRKPLLGVEDGARAAKIAYSCKESFETKTLIKISKES
ncbi:MAG: Gfo/Idh/MocA family oxidoreductase [Johnsonella sp.]|nr:Gfo/Idh/MocA family oxidoreductase [Johnsonella sp.]